MLWMYDHYKYFYSYIAGIYFSRQNLTTKVASRAEKVNPFLATLSYCEQFESIDCISLKD